MAPRKTQSETQKFSYLSWISLHQELKTSQVKNWEFIHTDLWDTEGRKEIYIYTPPGIDLLDRENYF
jgi:hypothetical protein